MPPIAMEGEEAPWDEEGDEGVGRGGDGVGGGGGALVLRPQVRQSEAGRGPEQSLLVLKYISYILYIEI